MIWRASAAAVATGRFNAAIASASPYPASPNSQSASVSRETMISAANTRESPREVTTAVNTTVLRASAPSG